MSRSNSNRSFLPPIFLLPIVIFFIIVVSFLSPDKDNDLDISIDFDSKIGITKNRWLVDANGWRKDCLDHWDEKKSGVSGNINNLESYITKCPKDAEAGIYYNNFKARELNRPTIKIAASVPISKKIGVFDSIELLKGVELAQRKINKQGGIFINEQQAFLEVGIIDEGWNIDKVKGIENWNNKSDKDKEKTISRLVANSAVNSEILGIVGHFSSDAIEAAAPIYKDELVAISPTSTAVRQLNEHSDSNNILNGIFSNRQKDKNNENKSLSLNSYIFRTATNDKIAIDRLKTKYIVPKNINKIIVVYEQNSIYSQLYIKELKTQLENEIINENNCALEVDSNGNIQLMEVDNCANNIKVYEPDALILVFSTAKVLELETPDEIDGETTNFFKLIKNKTGDSPQLIGSDSFYDEHFLDEGNIVSVPMESQKKVFPTAIEDNQYKRIEVNWRTSTAYDAVITIAEGIEKSEKCSKDNSKKKCRQQIQKSLSSEEFVADGILGNDSIKFDNGDRKLLKDNDSLGVILEVKNLEDKNISFIKIESD